MHNLIERTYKDVIKDNFYNGKYIENLYYICYGNDIPSNFAKNNELVLKIIYSRNKKKLSDLEFIQNMKEKEKFLLEISESIKKTVKSKLGINCTILIEKIDTKN